MLGFQLQKRWRTGGCLGFAILGTQRQGSFEIGVLQDARFQQVPTGSLPG